MKPLRSRAFTMIELLVVVAIISILAAVAVPVMGHVQKSGRLTNELSAARQVIAAYITAAGDNDGQLLAGYNNKERARDDRGQELKNPINARYPWRLAPYLQYDLGVLYGKVGDQRLRQDRERHYDAWLYSVSVTPAFGMNTVFVGGDYSAMNPDNPRAITAYGSFCVTHLAQAVKPIKLIVFASACLNSDGKRVPGYFKVEAPYMVSRRWDGEYLPRSEPERYGNVDFRYDDKAIVAMLDGHVETLDFKEADDMRRWSNIAADLDRPTWKLGDK